MIKYRLLSKLIIMIISASRRTDIPAFYSRWFMNRLRAGFVDIVNPFNPSQVRRVDLIPEAVDIGAYDTCGYRCIYCYANSSSEKAATSLRNLNVNSSSLYYNI